MVAIVLSLPVISSTPLFSITEEGIKKRRGDRGEGVPCNRECSAPCCSSSNTSHPPSRERSKCMIGVVEISEKPSDDHYSMQSAAIPCGLALPCLTIPCLCHALSSTMAPHGDPQMSQASHAITLSDIPPVLLRTRAVQQVEGQG